MTTSLAVAEKFKRLLKSLLLSEFTQSQTTNQALLETTKLSQRNLLMSRRGKCLWFKVPKAKKVKER
jgi:hypothetical protein